METDNADMPRLLTWESRALYLDVLSGKSTAPSPGAALNELIGMRLVAPDPDRPGHYRALSAPDAAIRWQAHFQDLATQHLAQAARIPTDMQDLINAYQVAHPARASGALEYVTGPDVVQDRLTPLLAACSEELLTAQPNGARPAAQLALSYQRDLAVLSRGATMRTIYRAPVRRDAPTARWALTMTGEGAQIRTTPVAFVRTVIIDQQVAVIECPDPNRALFVYDETLVAHIRAAWERDWTRALPWDGTPEIDVTDMQRAIIRALIEGVPLETIARNHGVTRRMISFHLEPLKTATGSASIPALLYWWGRNEEHYLS